MIAGRAATACADSATPAPIRVLHGPLPLKLRRSQNASNCGGALVLASRKLLAAIAYCEATSGLFAAGGNFMDDPQGARASSVITRCLTLGRPPIERKHLRPQAGQMRLFRKDFRFQTSVGRSNWHTIAFPSPRAEAGVSYALVADVLAAGGSPPGRRCSAIAHVLLRKVSIS